MAHGSQASVAFAGLGAGTTIGAVIRHAVLDPLETRILLGHVLGLSRVQLITQSERALNAVEAQQLGALMQRRLNGEPIAYLTGQREFFGLLLAVSPAVLIPRPETELLVELALQHLPPNGRVLDMGTGSGAIAIAIAHMRPDAVVTALDVSEAALEIARRNAVTHGAKVEFLHSDWYRAIDQRQFDLIVSNPPYIVAGDRHLGEGDLRFEPPDALTDHADGMSALRTISSQAPQRLVPNGWLLMEHGYDQAAAVRAQLADDGFAQIASHADLAGIERVSGGSLAIKAHPQVPH